MSDSTVRLWKGIVSTGYQDKNNHKIIWNQGNFSLSTSDFIKMLIVWQSDGIGKVEKIFVDLKVLTREKNYEIYGGIKRSRQLCTTTSYSVDCWQFGSLTFYYNLVPVRTWKLKINARNPFRRSSKFTEIPVTSLGSLMRWKRSRIIFISLKIISALFEWVFQAVLTIPTILVQHNPTADLVLWTSKQTRKWVSISGKIRSTYLYL